MNSIRSRISYKKEHAITKKLVLTAILKNISPLVLGSGQSDTSDLEVIKRSDGEVYIPGSALGGKIRTYFDEHPAINTKNSMKYFWGSNSTSVRSGEKSPPSFQSHIIIEDAKAKTTNTKDLIAIKDGVKINHTTALADGGAKYDYEVLEPGVSFEFRAEVTVRQMFETDASNEFEKLTDFVATILSNDLRIGAFTQAGFGRIECVGSPQIRAYDFPNDGEKWFEYLKDKTKNNGTLVNITDDEKIKIIKKDQMQLSVKFDIRNAFVTSTYGVTPDQADKTQAYRINPISNEKEYILSGKSIRGALRHRAKRILHSKLGLVSPLIPKTVNRLFGNVNEKTKEAVKSKLRVDEAIIKNAKLHKQTRIKMDRFTGGTIDGALMETEILRPTGSDNIELNFLVDDVRGNEVTLVLMLLKDLWTSDLPIGGEKNIGRGTLIGNSAELSVGEQSLTIERNSEGGINVTDQGNLIETYNSFNF